MGNSEIQQQLFGLVKQRLPQHLSLVDEVAATLNISSDSAYRRIRGEKPLDVNEVYLLCLKFQLSLDSLLHLSSDGFLFKGHFLNPHAFSYEDYLSDIVRQVKYMSGFKQRSITYLAKDIPLFHHFHFREIAAFKHYFWMKNILQHPKFAAEKFRLADYPEAYFQLGQKALSYYNQLDAVEFWNIESINSTLRQIDFYYESNIFSDTDDLFQLYDAAEKLVAHLEYQATEGYQFAVSDLKTPLAPYQLYFNEILILEGNILATLDGKNTAFLIHNVLNHLQTTDVRFCDNMSKHIQNLKRKSTLISTVSERERARFFNYLRQRIENRKQNLRSR